MKRPDPEGWAAIAHEEAREGIQLARITLWAIVAVFGAGIAAATYYGLPSGWSVLIGFVGLGAIISNVFLMLFWRLEAGRAYLEQAAHAEYEARIDAHFRSPPHS